MNNIDMSEIINRILNGENEEDVVSEVITSVNDAVQTAREELRKKKYDQYKRDDLQEILDLIHDFILEYYTDGSREEIDKLDKTFDEELTVDKVLEMIDSCKELADSLTGLADFLNIDTDPKGTINIKLDNKNFGSDLTELWKMIKEL